MTKKTRAKTRRALLSLSLVLVTMMVAVGGTIAWLTAESNTVTNTFTPSNIQIELNESTGETYKMVPGEVISKNPSVTVLEGSEDCYVFVKVEGLNDFVTFFGEVDDLDYGDNWQVLNGDANNAVIYYAVSPDTITEVSAEETLEYILAENKIAVLGTVTEENMADLTEETYPKLKFTAYAVQSANNVTDPATLWTQIQE